MPVAQHGYMMKSWNCNFATTKCHGLIKQPVLKIQDTQLEVKLGCTD